MPTYEYECTECGNRFEVFQRMSDAPIESCTACGGRVRRLVGGGAGVIVRGKECRAAAPGERAVPPCGRDASCCGGAEPCGGARPCGE